MGGGGSKSQTVGYKYYVGMHMALCHGPCDKLVRVRVGGKKAWVGESTGATVKIKKPELFGGEGREGGVTGSVDIALGTPTQPQNSYLASKLGSSLLPAFRGVMCAILKQIYIGTNPYPKDWGWFVQRIWNRSGGISQWYTEKAGIGLYQFTDSIAPKEYEVASSLSSYTLSVPEGSMDGVFSNDAGGLRHTPRFQAAGYAVAEWNGNLKLDWTVKKLTLSFMLYEVRANSNSARIAFYDAEGNALFYFVPWDKDVSDRPSYCTPTWNRTALHSTKLDVLQWYTITFEGDRATNTISVKLYLGLVAGGIPMSEHLFSNRMRDVRSYDIAYSTTASFADPSTSVGMGTVHLEQELYIPGEDMYGVCADMNPAHIIRECLTDATWGMGYPESDIDDTSFMSAADTLFSENMGISILWSQQTSIEDFVEEILRHIDAALYVDRTTGKFVLKLIRGGYDESALLVLDKSNISRVEGYTKQSVAELINEITVSYNSNETGQIETVTLQNLAMIQQQGAIIASSVEYMGFATEASALKAAARDLKALSSPIITATIYANRVAAGLNIGDVFVWNWDEYDEDGAGLVTSYVMRVSEVALGDGVDNAVRIQAVQDVFALSDITYVAAEPTEWVNPDKDPLPASPRLVMETPYYEVVRQLGELDATAKFSSLPELGYLMVAAGRPDSEINAEIYVDSGGGYAESGVLDFCPYADLNGAIGPLDTTVSIKNGMDINDVDEDGAVLVVPGSLAQIGSEIVVIESIVNDVATIKRGCLDTVPASHADGSAVIIWDGYVAGDGAEYVDSDELGVKILTTTGLGVLVLDDAPEDFVTMDMRANRPYPPADVKIGGAYYPSWLIADDLVGIVVTWAHRDRIQQTGGVVLGWTDASVGPEAGVTYSARLVRTDTEVEIDSSVGISGTTVTFTPTHRGDIRLEIWAVRGGTASFQIFSHTFNYISATPVYHDGTQAYCNGTEVYRAI